MSAQIAEPVPSDLAEALAQLTEAKETLRAIGSGEVDAFLISEGGSGHHVLTLSTADRPYRIFVERMRDGVATVAADGLILYVNDRLATMLGHSRESMIGTALCLYIAGPPPENWRVLGGADPAGTSIELELLGSGGKTLTALVGASSIDVDGEWLSCLTLTDLTEERAKDAEIARLYQAEMAASLRLSAVVEALQEGVLVQDGGGRVLQANRMASTLLGIDAADLAAGPPSPLSWGEPISDGSPTAREESPGREAFGSGLPVLGVTVPVHRGDDLAWLEINAVPVVIPGEPETPVVVSSYRDVTARIAADEAIRFQAELLDTAGQAIVAVDGEGVITYWNKHAEHMYGWSAPEAVGQSLADLILPEETVARGEIIVEAMQSGVTSSDDHWVRRRDGTLFPVFATSTPTLDDEGRLLAMITVATDITDRKHAEQEARHLSAIVESSTDAIIGMTLDHVITTWNVGATTLFGYQSAEAVGQSLAFLAPPGPDELLATLDAAAPRSFADAETRCRIKGGALVQISLSISPINDELGQAIGLSGIGRDITQRVALEQIAERNREQLLVAQHLAELEAIGREEANRANRAKTEFLSRMSHELRTPLNAVLGFSQVLLREGLSADQRESVGFISRAGEHLLSLINDVLDISRIEAGGLRPSAEAVNLKEVIDSALNLMRPQAAMRNISLPSQAGVPADLFVRSDRQRVLQILLNLLSNAVKYNRPNGSISLHCEPKGDTVALSVTDTGNGLTPSDLQKLFTPFERLGAERTDVEGAGVGLALSRTLAEEMGGTLAATSTTEGSTFTVTLPADRVSPDDMGDAT